MALVTVLPEVARNPTTNRLACGPMSTGCERTGFHSEVAAPADPDQRQNPGKRRPGNALLICLIEGSLAIKDRPKCEPGP